MRCWLQGGGSAVRICIPFAKDAAYVALCDALATKYLTNSDVAFSCVLGNTAEGCMGMIDTQAAEITMFGGRSCFHNHQYTVFGAHCVWR